MKNFSTYILLFIFISSTIFSQYYGNNLSVSTNFSYNTTAKIFLNPDANQFASQTDYFELEGLYSYSIEFRYTVYEALIFGLSIEYMSGAENGRNLSDKQFVVKDGFEIYPIELSSYYLLPFSTEDFKFYMGGGFGFYTGSRTREFGNVKFEDVDSESTLGIQVSTGVDYLILNLLSIRGEFRFRDPELLITNKYSSNNVIYNDNESSVTTNNIRSRLNVDGITFRIGLVYHY
jgi:opacity protein-like surface antigen